MSGGSAMSSVSLTSMPMLSTPPKNVRTVGMMIVVDRVDRVDQVIPSEAFSCDEGMPGVCCRCGAPRCPNFEQKLELDSASDSRICSAESKVVVIII
jgi:hypothetical protein